MRVCSHQYTKAPATIEALPEVVAAVNGRCEVYLDGGVCRGTDAFKVKLPCSRAAWARVHTYSC